MEKGRNHEIMSRNKTGKTFISKQQKEGKMGKKKSKTKVETPI